MSDAVAERLVAELFGGEIVYVPYVRPGFPLARAVGGIVDRLPQEAFGLALAHHGLVVWAGHPHECYLRLIRTVNRVEEYLAAKRRTRTVPGAGKAPIPPPEIRRRFAEVLLPVVRGGLGSARRVILHFDDADDVLEALADPEPARARPSRDGDPGAHPARGGASGPAGPGSISARGRDGRVGPLPSSSGSADNTRRSTRATPPRTSAALDDWAKVVLVPGSA